MTEFTSISILVNPKSTGSGQDLAKELKTQLCERLKGMSIEIISTVRSRHGEELAYKLASASSRPLIIIASGDGGYHELINGALRAQAEGASPTVGLLPGGNANDHYHFLHEDDLVERILKNAAKKIDVLELAGTIKGNSFLRYAHSYIGFGLTPAIGAELNKQDKNRLREIGITSKGLLEYEPFKIRLSGKIRTYDSLIFSNIGKMSKLLTLSKDADIQDGMFETTAFRPKKRWWLLGKLFKASIVGLDEAKQMTKYRLGTTAALDVQLDGEVYTLDSETSVTIRISDQKLRCIV